ncbi:MAG: hypothetical protein O3B25_08455 [Verrucomicrobia bacterium]|nr:hypothetical protein [Verrucomicrobiota bacterium]
MKTVFRFVPLLALVGSSFLHSPVLGQNSVEGIPSDEIEELNAKRIEAGKAASAARKKLAIRRVIREAEALIKKHSSSPNRYEVLSILFRSQQILVGLDKSSTNRKAFLATCEKLASAPNEYAALRLDADLLLTQAESARKGGDSHARSDALRPLVERYLDTEVEAKVIRVAMIMALELGNNRLVNDLRKVIAERLPGNIDLINFQRDKLAGQVFGAPFIGSFEWGDGKTAKFPMDFLGTTTAVYFWSKDEGGLVDLKELAEASKKALADPETNAPGRFRFVSVNLDDLPDAGESILREQGLDWPALRLKGGRDNPIYKAYCRYDPRVVTVSPTGYAAIFMSGGRSNRGYERNLQSWLARQWTRPDYNSHLQSILMGEFLIINPEGPFDPSAPPEWKAAKEQGSDNQDKLPRGEASVPEEKLRAIQSCFIDPPARYGASFARMRANYEKADALCREAIASHPLAPDLWVVRNRRIVALFGLWKLKAEYQYFAAAAEEARTALDAKHPPGTDVIARFCLARESLRKTDVDTESVIRDFAQLGVGKASGPVLAAAALLALDVADRKLHEEFRRAYLDEYSEHPPMWTATAFFLDRYHRYWMYHPPFVAGWTYGRRQGHFLAIGEPEDANRSLQIELKTLDGDTVRFPKKDEDQWTVISFVSSAEGSSYLSRYRKFAEERPDDNVKLLTAVLNDDANMTRKVLEAKKSPDPFPTMLVPGGMQNSIAKRLGMIVEDGENQPGHQKNPNLLLLRPDGSIALSLSGLTMRFMKANVIQNVIELHDAKMVDEALARGDLDEAKRLAFTFAPPEEATAEGVKKKPSPKISIPHLRSRAKVYLAMGDLKAAYADAKVVYLAVNQKAGYISMRTDDLEETEALRETIRKTLDESGARTE